MIPTFRVSKAEERSRTTRKPVHLFLRDVSTVDQAGRALLCRLAAKGVRLFGSGVYTSYLVRAFNPAGTEPLDSPNTGVGGRN